MQWRGRRRANILATENDDVMLFVGRWQKVLQGITQSFVGDLKHILGEDLLAP